jgi:hypothetical protein
LAFGSHADLVLLKRYRGFPKFSRHRLSFPCEPRKARIVGGLLNNRYATADFRKKMRKEIVFDRNFAFLEVAARGVTNCGTGQMTINGRATKKHKPDGVSHKEAQKAQTISLRVH